MSTCSICGGLPEVRVVRRQRPDGDHVERTPWRCSTRVCANRDPLNHGLDWLMPS